MEKESPEGDVTAPLPTIVKKRKQSNLETANQMFKDAFIVKKTRFKHLHPELSDEALHRMTVEYFRKLAERTP